MPKTGKSGNASSGANSRNESAASRTIGSTLNFLIFAMFAAGFGYFHRWHLDVLFENEKHFSHLSTLERELSFRTESGLYYYYFKILVSPPNHERHLLTLVYENILNDNRTEHPSTINSLQRFNLYPEVVLAGLYRLANNLGLLTKACYQIKRSDNMPDVQSCIGAQEPIYFYTNSVFILHGFSMAFLFTLCWLVNGKSLLAGIIGAICYIYNHGEATRVMWTPALRESFSFPFHSLQLVVLTKLMLSDRSTCRKNSIALTLTTLVYLLPWQFAQFSLGTQTAALFATYSIGFLSQAKLLNIVKCQTVALTACFALMFANRMLITSFFASLLASIWIILLFEKYVLKRVDSNLFQLPIWKRLVTTLAKMTIFLGLTLSIKKFILQIVLQEKEDDSHIWDILKSKYSNSLHTFDTRLYTCAKEFDFLDQATYQKLLVTCLLPIAALSFLNCLMRALVKYFTPSTANKEPAKDLTDQHNVDAVMVYHMFQLIAYSLMAFLIMRLKLFWTPYLCIFASFVAHKTFSYSILDVLFGSKEKFSRVSLKNYRFIYIVLFLSIMSYQGLQNLQAQYAIQGEYNDYSTERMMNWINSNTKLDDAFAGSMPTMANVKLSTNRPIINHPHYEDVGLRHRIQALYPHLYGFRNVRELHQILKSDYKARYLVVESHFCLSAPPGKPECAMSEIAHLHLKRTEKVKACESLLGQSAEVRKYFLKEFQSDNLSIFRII